MLYIKTKKLTKKSRTYAACRGFFLYSTVKHPRIKRLDGGTEHCGNHTEKAVIPKGLFYIFLFVLFSDPECIQ